MERRYTGKQRSKPNVNGRGPLPACTFSIVYVCIHDPIESKGLRLKVKGYEKCTVCMEYARKNDGHVLFRCVEIFIL